MAKIITVPPQPPPNPVTNNPPNPGIPTGGNPPPPSSPSVNVNINLDGIILGIVNSLNNTINGLIASVNKIDDIIIAQLNKSMDVLIKNNNNFSNLLLKSLDDNIVKTEKSIDAIITKAIKPLFAEVTNLERDVLEFEKKSQTSLEALFKQLIQSQSNQTNELVSTLQTKIDALIQTIQTTDYISEENLADWIKQALEPLEINWPSWAQQWDEQSNTLPFNPLQPLLDAIEYLISRIRDVKGSFDKLENGQYSSIDDFKTDLFGSETVGNIGESVMFLLLIVPLFKEIVQAVYAKMFTELNFLAIRKAQPSRLNEQDAFNLARRGDISIGEMYEQLYDRGWSTELIEKMFSASFAIPNMGDVFELYRRGEISKEHFNETLKRAGFSEFWITKLETLSQYIAPPQDVIRFMVRDAYNEEIIRQGGTDIGWNNPTFLAEAKRAGIGEDLARRYWIAHWQLPSVNQGYEMYQREEITRERLENLFVAADVAPNWREPLLALSYNLPTKVDVRRAYEDDIIQDEELREYIRHSGTPPNWQEHIFNWHKGRKLKLQSRKDTAKNFSSRDIIKGYTSGVLQQSEAVSKLVSIGWKIEDAILLLKMNEENELMRANESFTTKLREEMRNTAIDAYRNRTLSKSESLQLLQQSGISEQLGLAMLSLIDKQYELDRRMEIVNAVRKLYLGYDITEVQLFDTMLRNGFDRLEIEAHINDLKPLRNLRYKELARADIKKGTTVESLGIQWGINKLKSLGYSDKTIQEIMLIEKWDDSQNSISINGDMELSEL